MFLVSSKSLIFCCTRRYYSQIPHKIRFAMNVVYFRHTPEEENLQINFRYQNRVYNIDREFNFSRNINEELESCLERIRTNIEKEFNKKLKKKKVQKKANDSSVQAAANHEETVNSNPDIKIALLKNDMALSCKLKLADLFSEAHTDDLILRIIENDFTVAYNLPWVTNLVLPTSILAGFFIYPCRLALDCADKEKSIFNWYRGLMPKSKDEQKIAWEKISEGFIYKTRTEDIGYHIKVVCIPGNDQKFGPPVEYVSKCEIEAGPGFCPFENRHVFTTNKLSQNEFRIISYNILADLYADSDYTRKELFPYCPPYALSIDYRKQLFLKEILGYNSDIICLQEVDRKIFDLDLKPLLNIKNLEGIFQMKGNSGEGLAIFYDTSRFDLLEKHGINLGEAFPATAIFQGLFSKIRNNAELAQRVLGRTTTLQVSVMRSKDNGKILIVANTHLYFHPDADHIRLLQVGLCMLYIEDLYKKILKELSTDKSNVSILFCGDFNSSPDCGIYKLMTEKLVPDHFLDWKSNKEQVIKGVELKQPFSIQSACGVPKYTNFTAGFADCLDYIFYQNDNLEVKEVIPMPSVEELSSHTAIPSVVFPSDHIALVADLKWKCR